MPLNRSNSRARNDRQSALSDDRFQLHGQLIAQLATMLHVSADELLGVPGGRKAAHAPAPVVDKTLARRLAQLQQLPRRDREALLRPLDAYLSMAGPRAA